MSPDPILTIGAAVILVLIIANLATLIGVKRKVVVPGHVDVTRGDSGKWHFYLYGKDGAYLAISTGPGWDSEQEAREHVNLLWWK